MNLRNRNETRLLVENWRRVLEEGLYENDIETLEESLKQKLIMGMLMASNLVSGITYAKPQTSANAEKQAANLIMKAPASSQSKTPDVSPNFQLSKSRVAKAVQKCYNLGKKIFKQEINKDDKIKQWFANVGSAQGISAEQLIDNFSSEVPQIICNNYLDKISDIFPENIKQFPSYEHKCQVAWLILIQIFHKEDPTEEDFSAAVRLVTSEITSESVVARAFDLGGTVGAKHMFNKLTKQERGKNSFEQAIKDYFAKKYGDEKDLVEKLEDPTLMKRFLSLFE